MASCQLRGNKWYVVVSIKDEKTGTFDAEWLPFDDEDEARRVCDEITQEEQARKANKRNYKSVTNATRTIRQLIWEYIDIVGVNKWSPTTYTNNVARAENYIISQIGDVRVKDCNVLFMDKFFAKLKMLDGVRQRGKAKRKITAKTCEEVHKFLKAMFNQAIEWEMVDSNPCRKRNSTLSEHIGKKPPFWTMAQFLESAKHIEQDGDLLLLTALFVSVSTSMREGEVCGLQWPNCHITTEEIESGDCRIDVTCEIYRINKEVMKKQNYKDILFVFPDKFGTAKSSLVLKPPKSKSSMRTVWLPPTVAKMLVRLKAIQDAQKELLGIDYRDFDLVFAHPDGRPIEGACLNKWLQTSIEKHNLPRVTYHSTRHTSTTYKLKLSRGDIKNVQGDTGHGSAQMVTEVYAEIIDLDRKYNAMSFEAAYFGGIQFEESESVVDMAWQVPASVAAQVYEEAPKEALSSDDVIHFMSLIEKNPELVRQLLAANGVSG